MLVKKIVLVLYIENNLKFIFKMVEGIFFINMIYMIIVVVGGGVFIILMICLLIYCCIWKKKIFFKVGNEIDVRLFWYGL